MKTHSISRVASFVLVGSCAAAVHLATVILLVKQFFWTPIWANPVAWLIAFGVSFSGHWLLTFKDRQKTLGGSFIKFFCLSAAGFLVNELLYATLLGITSIRFDIILAGVLVVVAIATYLLSSLWAFAGNSKQH